MNNPNDKLIIESRSNYAFQLRGKNLSFSEIRNTSTTFFTSLPEGVRNELYNNMCHGTIKLDCEPELNAYMYAFGAMHNAKLKDAFSHLSTNFFNEREIDIIDYGCGQAMGCISYADYLRENNHTQNVRRITLIEPSYIALARAALHSSLLFPNAEIVTINKGFDDLTVSDIEVDSDIPTLHIFSNVLDMGSTPNYHGVFNLGTFSNLVLEISKGYNEYVITEPLFSDFHRDEQADIFTSSLGINVYYERKCSAGEFVTNRTWTCVIKCGCVGLPDVKVSSLQKDSWTWYEFRRLYGKPKLASFKNESTNELYKKVVFIDESNEANKVYVKFSRLHGELSKDIIKKNKDNILIHQKIDYKGERYYELELKCYSTDKGDVMPNNEIWYTSSDGKIVEPDRIDCFGTQLISNTYIDGKGILTFKSNVTKIGNLAFCHCNRLTSVFIPSGVTTIGEHAFSGCTNLASITIPDSVTNIGQWAFSDCTSLTNIIIPNSVTKIEESVFCRCESLISITIPNDLTTIGVDAFGGCCNLKSVTIPDTVTIIEDCAFGGCKNLTHVTLPSGITKIGSYAFSGCASLTEVVIPESVIEIGGNAFSNCKNLKKIRGKFAQDNGRCLIKDGKLIAFAPAELTQYTIPNNVTEIGDGVFADCKSFSSIIIPDSVVTIGYGAFSGCSSLKEISIPNSVTEIEFDAFRHCAGITNITIPNNVGWIGWSAFVGCNNLKEFKGKFATDDGRCLICCGRLLAFAPAELTQYTIPNNVIIIDHDVFSGCNNLASISIPNGVQKIENGAFKGCCNLNTITLPSSVTTIGNWSFQGCSNLKSIYIKAITPPILGHSAFIYESEFLDDKILECMIYVPRCSVDAYIHAERWSQYAFQIKSIDVAENAIQLNDNILPNNEIWYITFNDKVLDDCQVDRFNVPIISNIYENGKGVIRFEGDVTEIRFGAFFLCSSLISITIPNSVIIIEDYAFYGCSKLKEFKGSFAADNGRCLIDKGRLISFANNCGIEEYVIPNNVTEIGNNAFADCYNLKKIIIPNSVTKIGSKAFSGCQNLASITLSQSITEIEDATFAICRCLTHLIIPNGVTKIGDGAFEGCTSLKELTIPNTVTKMGNGVFNGCTSIVNVNIPNEITEIGDRVFKDCSSLSEINIPKDVIMIGKETFSGCSSLSMITIPSRVKTIGRDIFYRCTNLKNVYCMAAILPQHHKDTFVFFEHIRYTIYVPRELVNVYKNADDWELYADKIVGYDFE